MAVELTVLLRSALTGVTEFIDITGKGRDTAGENNG